MHEVDAVVEEIEEEDEADLAGAAGEGGSHLVEAQGEGSVAGEEEEEVEVVEHLVLVEVEEEVSKYSTTGGLIFCAWRSVRVVHQGRRILA